MGKKLSGFVEFYLRNASAAEQVHNEQPEILWSQHITSASHALRVVKDVLSVRPPGETGVSYGILVPEQDDSRNSATETQVFFTETSLTRAHKEVRDPIVVFFFGEHVLVSRKMFVDHVLDQLSEKLNTITSEGGNAERKQKLSSRIERVKDALAR
ncbi:unnamed protein product [Amoebophrya sp. A120]|nr:unnamed protein product [Amoebophrya sp. A120]|eukprot:GSA120T00010485001.1